jgi:hypothetical protein
MIYCGMKFIFLVEMARIVIGDYDVRVGLYKKGGQNILKRAGYLIYFFSEINLD